MVHHGINSALPSQGADGVRKVITGIAFLALVLPTTGFSLGLGEIHIDSALNQPLKGQIDLLSVKPDEMKDLDVTLASRKVFQRVGVARTFNLTKLKFEPTVKPNGQAIIKVTSRKPIREPFLTFLVELNWPQGRLLREYTVLLDPPVYQQAEASQATQAPSVNAAPAGSSPDQTQGPTADASQDASQQGSARQDSSQASRVAAESAASPGSTGVSATAAQTSTRGASAQETSGDSGAGSAAKASTPRQVNIHSGDTLWEVAEQARPSDSVSVAQMMLALQRANPEAFGQKNINNLKNGAILRIPNRKEIDAADNGEVVAEVDRQNVEWQAYRAQLADNTEPRNIDAGAVDSAAGINTTASAESSSAGSASEPNAEQVAAHTASGKPGTRADAPSQQSGKSAEADNATRSNKSAGEAPGAAADSAPNSGQDANDGRLEIASSDQPTAPGQTEAAAVTGTKASTDAGSQALEELAESRRQQNAELQSRLDELEGMLTKQEKIIKLQNKQLAELQARLGDVDPSRVAGQGAPGNPATAAQGTAGAAAAADTVDGSTTPGEPSADTGSSASDATGAGAGDSATAAPNASSTAAGADATGNEASRNSATKAATEDSAAAADQSATNGQGVTTSTTEKAGETSAAGGLIERITQFINPLLMVAIGVVVLLLAGLGWVFAKRKAGQRSLSAAELDDDPYDNVLEDTVVTQANDQPAAITGVDAFMQTSQTAATEGDGVDAETTTAAASHELISPIDDTGEDTVPVDDEVLVEADAYITYGLYQQAENLLEDALHKEPHRSDYRDKLLEVSYEARDTDTFEEAARAVYATLAKPAESDHWQHIAERGRDLAPDNPLYNELGDASGSDEDPVESPPEGPVIAEQPEAQSLMFENTQAMDVDPANSDESIAGDNLETRVDGALAGYNGNDDSLDFDISELEDYGFQGADDEDPNATQIASASADMLDFELSDLAFSQSDDGGQDDAESSTARQGEGMDLSDDLGIEASAETDSATEADTEFGADDAFIATSALDLTMAGRSSNPVDRAIDSPIDSEPDDGDQAADSPGQTDGGLEEPLIDTSGLDLTDEERFVVSNEGDEGIAASDDLDALGNAQGLDEAGPPPDDSPQGTGESAEEELPGLSDRDLEALNISSLLSNEEPAAAGFSSEQAELDETEIYGSGEQTEIFPGSFDTGDFPDSGYDSVDVVGTKLDLAKAYIDMGDTDGARCTLEEVMEEGDNTQREEAEGLMTQIA